MKAAKTKETERLFKREKKEVGALLCLTISSISASVVNKTLTKTRRETRAAASLGEGRDVNVNNWKRWLCSRLSFSITQEIGTTTATQSSEKHVIYKIKLYVKLNK